MSDFGTFEGDLACHEENSKLTSLNANLARENDVIRKALAEASSDLTTDLKSDPKLPLIESAAASATGVTVPSTAHTLHIPGLAPIYPIMHPHFVDPPIDFIDDVTLRAPPPFPESEARFAASRAQELEHERMVLGGLVEENMRIKNDNAKILETLSAHAINPIAATVIHKEALAEENDKLRQANARMHQELMFALP